MVSLDPTSMGVLIRMQTPDGDESSILAGARCDAPAWSCQQTSATAIIGVLGVTIGGIVISLYMPLFAMIAKLAG